jgi:hypothetical protein
MDSRCEHYNRLQNRDHFLDFTISDGLYDIDYIEAVLCEDQEEVDRIEYAALELGYGPRVECTNVSNFSTQRVYCREYLVSDLKTQPN